MANGTVSCIFAWSILLIGCAAVMAGCGSSEGSSTPAAVTSHRAAEPLSAKVTLQPFGGGKATGTAVFTKESGRNTLKIELSGLDPTRRQGQYYLWQIETPKDRVSLKTADNMVSLASYRVGASGDLSAELEPAAKALITLERGDLTHFLVTKVDSPASLQDSILEFDKTGNPPDLGLPIAEGAFSGSLVGAAEPR